MEILKCDRCEMVYDDPFDVAWAKEHREKWKETCQQTHATARGIAPCPILRCPGELLLVVEEVTG